MVSESYRPTRTALPPGAAALADAARAVRAVSIEGQSADKSLAAFHHSANRSAIRAIALGSLRWYLRLAPGLEALLTHPAMRPRWPWIGRSRPHVSWAPPTRRAL